MQVPIQSRLAQRSVLAAAAAGGIAAVAVAERRHLRALAGDEEFAELTAPLGGRPLAVTSADGTALHAEVFGPEDGSTVVLAHGWTEELSFWGPVIRRLTAAGLRAVAYDLRGHGRSSPAADADYALARFGDDLEAVLDAAGDERVTVAGHSLGAMSIAAWAQRHDPGRRARAAALINTGLGDLWASNLLFGELATLLNRPWAGRAFLGSHLRVPPFSTPLQEALIRHLAFGPHASRGAVAFYERMLIHCPADARAATGLALSQMDLWDALARLTIPTLVVDGERDRLTPPALAQRMARELPDCVGLIELPDTGHMSPLERPQAISDALLRLVKETDEAPEVVGERG